MAKVKVEVTGAVVDGNPSGSVIEVDEKSAYKLEKIGYVRKVKAEAKSSVTEKSAPKKSASKSKPKANISKDK